MTLSLRSKILLCALLNLVLWAGALLVYLQSQFQAGLQSIVLLPAQERSRALADSLVREMGDLPPDARTELLARHERRHHLDLGIFLNTGTQVGGRSMTLPQGVLRLLVAPRQVGSNEPPRRRPRPPIHTPDKNDMWRGDKGRGDDVEGGGPPRRGGASLFLSREAGAYWIGARIPVIERDDPMAYEGTLIIRSEYLWNPFLLDVRPWLTAFAVLVVITLLCWLPLVHRLTAAIKRTTRAAEEIASGKFDVKLPLNRGDEIDQLSEALNRMAAQLRGFVHGQKRFLGDVAHELSAPVARSQVALEILNERAEPPQVRYVESVREEVRHMSELVNELLQFSKAGLNPDEKARVDFRIGDVVDRVVERESVDGVEIKLLEGSDLRVHAQPDGVLRALCNVVRNAIRYAGEGGPIEISAIHENRGIAVVVADHGPGVPEESLERLFSPFYRVDRARTRETGGVGLGLAIVKTSVEANGGKVICRNRKPNGLEVRVWLPAAANGTGS